MNGSAVVAIGVDRHGSVATTLPAGAFPTVSLLQSETGSHTTSAHSMTNSVGSSSCERTSPTPTLSESFSQR